MDDDTLDDSHHYVTLVLRFNDEVDSLGVGFVKQANYELDDVTCVVARHSYPNERQEVDERYAWEQERLTRFGGMGQ